MGDTTEKTPYSPGNNQDMGKQINPVPAPVQELGIDLNDQFMDSLINAGISSTLDVAQLQSFQTISQSRETIYTLLDTMAEDSTISAVLETYAEDATETNEQGKIVWCEASDVNIAKFVTFLLDQMNVDKNIYKWVHTLCKYGDLYLKLYRKSEFEDGLLDEKQQERNTQVQSLNESIKAQADPLARLENPDIDKTEDGNILNEDVNVRLYADNDNYADYIEMVSNPAEMFELTKFGKSYAYIQAETVANKMKAQDPFVASGTYRYSFNKRDVNVYDATCFVHAALEDNSSRIPEEVRIFMGDGNPNDNSLMFKVRRGQSLLYNAFKIWREMTMLENSMLLNRVTKSSTVRIVNVEVGDMPKEQIGPHLQGVKSLFEQKSAINAGNSLQEYTNPGPVENNIYIPTHNQQGSITVNSLGDGEVNVGNLNDIDYFRQKLFGSLKIPSQFFGFCLRGNTLIPLLNGEVVSIKDMYDDKYSYIGKGIMGCAADGSLKPTVITNIALTRPEARFIRIHLDNGDFVDVTDNHQMMLRDGTFLPASEVKEGDSLMPFSVTPDLERGHEVIRIEQLEVVEPAYDITVADDCHTFALQCGIFVHNCDDSTGFNGGTSLSIISSRYAKSIIRIQNTVIQAITDVINLMLLDKGLTNYVNKFELHMLPPTTQDEITRRDNVSSKIGVVRDTMDLLSDIEDASARLKIVQCLVKGVVNDGEVLSLIQDQIDKLEELENVGVDTTPPTDEFGNINSEAMGGYNTYDDGVGEISGVAPVDDFGFAATPAAPEAASPDMDINLPSPNELGVDFTDNTAF